MWNIFEFNDGYLSIFGTVFIILTTLKCFLLSRKISCGGARIDIHAIVLLPE